LDSSRALAGRHGLGLPIAKAWRSCTADPGDPQRASRGTSYSPAAFTLTYHRGRLGSPDATLFDRTRRTSQHDVRPATAEIAASIDRPHRIVTGAKCIVLLDGPKRARTAEQGRAVEMGTLFAISASTVALAIVSV
jgi:hypothetical protein